MQVTQSWYSEQYDFAMSTRVLSELMVATLPRAGSTFFCVELWRTGVLGAPLEYANFGASVPMRERLVDYKEMTDYWQKIKELRTGPNGMFSYKMFMSMYMEHGRATPSMLKQFKPDKVVYLTRKDKLAQAISYSKAIKSKKWFADAHSNQEPIYDQKHIIQCERSIRHQEKFWENLFSLTQTSVYRTYYEDFLENSERIKDEICEWVGERLDPSKFLDIPNIEKQGDETNLVWAEKYLEQKLSL
jgi:LPS sulfotransferase NodH